MAWSACCCTLRWHRLRRERYLHPHGMTRLATKGDAMGGERRPDHIPQRPECRKALPSAPPVPHHAYGFYGPDYLEAEEVVGRKHLAHLLDEIPPAAVDVSCQVGSEPERLGKGFRLRRGPGRCHRGAGRL